MESGFAFYHLSGSSISWIKTPFFVPRDGLLSSVLQLFPPLVTVDEMFFFYKVLKLPSINENTP